MINEQLFTTANALSHEECIINQAEFIYRKIIKKCKQQALFGNMEVTVDFVSKNDQVLRHVIKLLKDQNLHIGEGNVISWSKSRIVPRLTSRHLVEMGYNPANGDLFRQILDSVRMAIAKGMVSNELIDGQIQWVKEHFRNF